jgi:hypothetical protein
MKVELSGIELATIRLSLMDKIEKAEECIKMLQDTNNKESEKFWFDIKESNKNLLERLYKI